MAFSRKAHEGPPKPPEEIFTFPFLTDEETVEYLCNHGRIMFLIRGPSGTFKGELSSLLCKKYPTSVVCSAMQYFSTGRKFHYESKKKSHEYCEQRAQQMCKENQHPIILENSHVRKWEAQYYIDLAVKHSYTLIMCETPNKVSVDPKKLVRRNKNNLTFSYLSERVITWDEIIPSYFGWFLNPSDEDNLQKHFMAISSELAKNEEFTDEFSVSSKGEQIFKPAETHLFCSTSYTRDSEAEDYYMSTKVQNAYGKQFTLEIAGFVITDQLFAALVPLCEDKQALMYENNLEFNSSSFEEAFATLAIHSLPKRNHECYNLEKIPSKPTLQEKESEEGSAINASKCSFIILGNLGNSHSGIKSIGEFSKQVFSESSVLDSKGNLQKEKFSFLLNERKVFKVKERVWLICPKTKLIIQSVLTGLYT